LECSYFKEICSKNGLSILFKFIDFFFQKFFEGKRNDYKFKIFLPSSGFQHCPTSTRQKEEQTDRKTDRKTKRKNPKKFSLKAYYIKHAISGQKKKLGPVFFFHQNSLKRKKNRKTKQKLFFSAFNLKRLSTKRYFFPSDARKTKT
jgi:hypothetical protein